MALRMLVLAALATASNAATLKVAGYLKDAGTKRYRTAFMKFVSWAQTHRANDYQVDVTKLMAYTTLNQGPAINWQGNITSWTTPGNADAVDVIICPYTSSKSALCADAVNSGFVGPVFVWGGASDSIFTSNCAVANMPQDNCYGFFTPASMYMQSGLNALAAKLGATQKVLVIKNSNSFSTGVAAGADTTITNNPNLTKQGATVSISVNGAALTTADEAAIVNAMAVSPGPDVVVVAGHNGDVEPAIIKIAKQAHNPKAILATNAFTATGNYGSDTAYIKCLMMPDQMATNPANGTDPVIGWSDAAFATAMGGAAPNYQEYAIGAVGVALANALDANKAMSVTGGAQVNGANLKLRLNSMDIMSFYGQLNWQKGTSTVTSSYGKINKPMFTSQYLTPTATVAPTGQHHLLAGASTLASSSCWNTAGGAGGGTQTSGASHGGFSILAVLGMILELSGAVSSLCS